MKTMTETYTRVIPRDLFNEAKLLKCVGRLALLILDAMTPCKIEIEESGEPFEIGQLEDGDLTITNYRITVKEQEFTFKTRYNSKDNYPLFLQTGDYEDFLVFDEQGQFTQEFISFTETI